MLNREQTAELYNLYHLARTALAGRPADRQTRYDRKLWAAAEYGKLHPEASPKEIYRTFERAEAGLI